MKDALLYHLNAYTYGDPKWFPDMDPKLREMFQKVTKGALSGDAGGKVTQDWAVNGEYVDTPEKGVVDIPFLDKYVDSMVELDTRVGRIMDKLRALGLDKNTLVFFTTDNGVWQDVYPDAGYTPFRGTQGTDRDGGNRVPAIAWMPGKIKDHSRNNDIGGGMDLMATFAHLAGLTLPEKDREGQPIIFDSYDIFMNNFTEHTWTLVTFNEAIGGLMKTSINYPPRKLQSEVDTGPITLTKYQNFQYIRESLKKGRHQPSDADRQLGRTPRSARFPA